MVLGYIERESWTSFASVVSPTMELWTLSLWLCSAQQLEQRLRGAVVAAQCRTDTALTSWCSGGSPWQPQFFRLAPVSRFHSSVLLFHLSLSLIGLLTSMDVKQQKSINQPAVLAERLGSFTCYCGNTGVEQIMQKVMQQPNSAGSTELWWILKNVLCKIQTHKLLKEHQF